MAIGKGTVRVAEERSMCSSVAGSGARDTCGAAVSAVAALKDAWAQDVPCLVAVRDRV
jgi:hypothetical protein